MHLLLTCPFTSELYLSVPFSESVLTSFRNCSLVEVRNNIAMKCNEVKKVFRQRKESDWKNPEKYQIDWPFNPSAN